MNPEYLNPNSMRGELKILIDSKMKFLVDSLPYYGEYCPFQDVCNTNKFDYKNCPRSWDKYFVCSEKNPYECEFLKEGI